MASLKFMLTNYIETATLKNGTGGGAPVRNEVAPYVMEKTQYRSRRQFWQKASAATLDVDFLLAGSTALDAGGIAGMAGIGGAGIATFTMQYQTGAYAPAGSWTNIPGRIAVAVASALDSVASFSSQVTADSIRFSLTSVPTVFTLGDFVVGKHDYDLGFLYSSLHAEKFTPQFEDRSIGQDAVINYIGYDRETWSLQWSAVQNATLASLEAVRVARKSVWVLDKSGVGREFTVTGARLPRDHRFEQASDTIYDMAMDLEQVV